MVLGPDVLVDHGHADCCARTDTKSLEKSSSHVASISRGHCCPNGGNKSNNGANDENDSSTINVRE